MGVNPQRAFADAAKTWLADAQQRANLRNATTTIRDKRAAAVGEMPDWSELRAAGAAIKDRALLSLDDQLERLEAQVTDRGGVVHWAPDGDAANRIVCGLAQDHGVDEVVKVKSILTDEIELNKALASAGIAAIETDLAELIVQLGGDVQSHILVPAIHRNRAEIRDLFLRALDVDELSDEPQALVAAARTHLRAKFLDARMAVSGANFAVAETGTVCVVESEGNGRMCTTLPDVLVTVMGVEKLVSEWADMEAMLQLLPRSSTGERMNPYTSFWSGVREGDGPREFHLVLVDNARSRSLADPVGRQALRCIRCSACLNVCPVYSRAGGQAYGSVYPGPIGAILTPQLSDAKHAATLPFASSLCGACGDVCPVNIEIPRLLVHLRGKEVDARSRLDPERITMAGVYKVFRSRAGYERAQAAGQLAQLPFVRDGMIRRGPGPLGEWTSVRDLPAMPETSFRRWWIEHRGASGPDVSVRAPRAPRTPRTSPRRRRRVSAPVPEVSARQRVLDSIRAAIGAEDPVVVPRNYRRQDDSARPDLVARFVERAGEYGARVQRIEPDGIGAAVTDICKTQGAARIGVPADLPEAWRPLGVTAVADSHLTPSELDALDGALTGSAVAIAETGTFVLDGGAAQGRRALTLVPDLHICVVYENQIVGLVPEATEELSASVRAGRPLTFVSGPSATSDIELDRVAGVHGPRRLEVLVVTDRHA
jgi:iron-sulfur cluster protein